MRKTNSKVFRNIESPACNAPPTSIVFRNTPIETVYRLMAKAIKAEYFIETTKIFCFSKIISSPALPAKMNDNPNKSIAAMIKYRLNKVSTRKEPIVERPPPVAPSINIKNKNKKTTNVPFRTVFCEYFFTSSKIIVTF